MGIKGTVRRSTDGDFIHANVDIDLIITEEVRCILSQCQCMVLTRDQTYLISGTQRENFSKLLKTLLSAFLTLS